MDHFEAAVPVFVTVLAIVIVAVLVRMQLTKSAPGEDKESSVGAGAGAALPHDSQASDEKVLSASQFRTFTVLKTTKVSPNVKSIRFELPAGRSLGLGLGRHVTLRTEADGQKILRSYTPTTRIDQKGYFDLLIKRYEMGKMSSFLYNLKVGQPVEVRGPVGRFQYQSNAHSHIGLIAGGTGLTPCLQLARNVLECPQYQDDRTRFTLFFQNRTEEDILLQQELNALVKRFPQRLEVIYFLSNADKDKNEFGQVPHEVCGYICQKRLLSKLSPDHCSLVCICGPSGFNDAMKKHLLAIGHDDENVFIW